MILMVRELSHGDVRMRVSHFDFHVLVAAAAGLATLGNATRTASTATATGSHDRCIRSMRDPSR
jgi:hypothetical protein